MLRLPPCERFTADAPERKKTRDDLRTALKGFRTPAEIDAQIKEMEDAERQADAELKAQEFRHGRIAVYQSRRPAEPRLLDHAPLAGGGAQHHG